YLPSVNMNFSGSRNIGRTFNENTGNITNRSNNSLRGSVSANLPLFSGFENLHALKSSRLDQKSKEESKERVREDIIFNTASNYLQFLLDKKFLEIDKENLEVSKKTLEQVKAQVDVGARHKVDLYNQQATVANNELDVVNARNAVQTSRLQLIQTLQIDPLKEYSFATPEIDSKQVRSQSYNLKQLTETALHSRSDLQSEEFNIQSIKQQLSAARSRLYPTLSLSATLSSSYSELQPLGFHDQFFDINIFRSIGLSLSVPIFDNLDRRTSVETQRINYKNAKLNLENLRLQVVQEVNQAYNDYQSYYKQLQSSQKALKAAKRNFYSQKQRYEVGAGTLIELSDANAQYVEAQANRAQALFRVVFQQKLLDYHIGKLEHKVSL